MSPDISSRHHHITCVILRNPVKIFKFSSKATVDTQTQTVVNEKSSLVTVNKESDKESDNNNSTNMINQLNKVRSDKRTEYYAHKKATASHKVSFNIPIQQEQTKVQKTKGILTQSKISNSQPQIIHPSTQKPGNIDMTAGNVTTNKNHTWAPGTTLIIGDSMIGGIRETQIAPRKNIKVRSFAGATVRDMKDYVLPLLRKKPSRILVHVGTNDAVQSSADEIVEKIVGLRDFIKSHLDVPVIISSPINRQDKNDLAIIIRNVNAKLKSLKNIDLIFNDNIILKHLGKQKLHLNTSGTTQLVRNFLCKLRSI